MGRKQQPLLIPAYYSQFSCLGSACEDLCCTGWTVPIDRPTYKKYRNMRKSPLGTLLNDLVKRNPTPTSDQDYALIPLTTGGNCPALTSDGLCRVHLELGEDHLSTVCATYPRMATRLNGVVEKSLSVSCPEAARLALLNPAGIDFVQTEEPDTTRNMYTISLNTHHPTASGTVAEHLWELRIFTITVLQNRAYTVSDRMIILGMFYQKLEDLQAAKQLDQLSGLIESFSASMANGGFQEGLLKLEPSPILQMKVVTELGAKRFRGTQVHPRYRECFLQFVEGIGYRDDASLEELAAAYQAAYAEFYQPFMQEHEYILENYLVNYAFQKALPFSPTGPFDAYVKMAFHFALIKLLLIGMAGYHKGLTEELIIKLIQSFGRSVAHSPAYEELVLKVLGDTGSKSMAHMAILLRN